VQDTGVQLAGSALTAPQPRTGRSAALVAVGILCSRLVGLVRQRVIAHYFGLATDVADAWAAGFRIPNLVQNLFGEGALSASFIPVYAARLAQGDDEEADRIAGAVGALLALVVAVLVLIGVAGSRWLIDLIAPGFSGARRELTIAVVRILFPGMGLLVMSAWCLGILNSHRKFFLSYTAPVSLNLAMIATLVWFGPRSSQDHLAIALAWGSVVGSVFQVLVQLPPVFRLLGRVPLSLGRGLEEVRTILRNFGPVFISRGVVQISAYIDMMLASWLPSGAPTALANAQLLYTLPVSLFGMTVSAAELPGMSSLIGSESEVAGQLR